jgi:hypothetical protein
MYDGGYFCLYGCIVVCLLFKESGVYEFRAGTESEGAFETDEGKSGSSFAGGVEWD